MRGEYHYKENSLTHIFLVLNLKSLKQKRSYSFWFHSCIIAMTCYNYKERKAWKKPQIQAVNMDNEKANTFFFFFFSPLASAAQKAL